MLPKNESIKKLLSPALWADRRFGVHGRFHNHLRSRR
jgi:hypothetical protein